MGISDKTRKILWARSGNRCAICRCELVQTATSLDDDSVIGDECHIVASEPNGPRGNFPLPMAQRDAVDNLILLCKIHHKVVDDQPNKYTAETLKELKKRHESWARETLGAGSTSSRSNDKTFVTYRIKTGKQLLFVVGGSHAYHFDNDDLETEDEANLVGDFLQNAQDYGDLWEELESRARIQAQFEFDKIITELDAANFLVYGCQRKEKLQTAVGIIDDWLVAYILVVRKNNPLAARKEEAVEKLFGIQGSLSTEFTSFIVVKRK